MTDDAYSAALDLLEAAVADWQGEDELARDRLDLLAEQFVTDYGAAGVATLAIAGLKLTAYAARSTRPLPNIAALPADLRRAHDRWIARHEQGGTP